MLKGKIARSANGIIIFVFALAVGVGSPATRVPSEVGQNNAEIPVPNPDFYEAVLDKVFSVQPPSEKVMTVILRFKPSSHPEQELIIFQTKKGWHGVMFEAPENIYLWLQHQSPQDQKFNAADIATRIHVSRSEIELSDRQAKAWLANISRALPLASEELSKVSGEYLKTGSVTLALDGTSYDISLIQGSNSIISKLYDQEIDQHSVSGILQLTRVVNRIRLEVLQMLNRTSR